MACFVRPSQTIGLSTTEINTVKYTGYVVIDALLSSLFISFPSKHDLTEIQSYCLIYVVNLAIYKR